MSSPAIEMTDARERTLSNTSIGSGDGDMIRPAGFSYGRRRTLSQTGAYGRVVILAVDPSDNAKMAMERYLSQVHRETDYIVLVHCPEVAKLPTFSFKSGMAPPVDEWKKILDEMNEKTRKLEEDYEGTCIAKKLRYKVRGEAMKNPGEGIVKIAEEERAEMIVMGTRGVGGMKRAISGSVSDFVMRNATCPVITVPGQKIAKRRQSEAAIHE